MSDERRAMLLVPRCGIHTRLSPGLAVLVIAVLSALAWAVLLFLIMGLWRAL